LHNARHISTTAVCGVGFTSGTYMGSMSTTADMAHRQTIVMPR